MHHHNADRIDPLTLDLRPCLLRKRIALDDRGWSPGMQKTIVGQQDKVLEPIPANDLHRPKHFPTPCWSMVARKTDDLAAPFAKRGLAIETRQIERQKRSQESQLERRAELNAGTAIDWLCRPPIGSLSNRELNPFQSLRKGSAFQSNEAQVGYISNRCHPTEDCR